MYSFDSQYLNLLDIIEHIGNCMFSYIYNRYTGKRIREEKGHVVKS